MLEKIMASVLTAGVIIASGAANTIEQAPEIKFQRTEVISSLEIGKRHRATKEPLIYARIQPYDLYSNYLHKWIDRPLFINREWRETQEGRDSGFLKDIQIAKEYGVDGFTMLGNAYKNRFQNYLKILERKRPENFSFMPGLAWGGISYERFLENAKLGLQSKYSPRINGKVPFFSYSNMPLPEILKIREKLAEDGCKEILLFCDIWFNAFSEYNNEKKLSNETVSTMEAGLREKLDVVDGVILTNYHMHRNPLGDYTLSKKFYFEMDKNYVAPLLEKVYDEEKNKEKLLGFNVRHGYLNHMAGTNEAEHGTEQLRQAMDTALLFNPDIISLVEWNEANENTSFQPTVYNSKSLQRIIKFYACKMKNVQLSPNEGDNLNIPNLIVSSRQVLQLGEKYRIELLNVPDCENEKSYTVQLTLRDENGKIIRSFEPDAFMSKKLTAITYTLPSEQFTGLMAVLPELTIINETGVKTQFTSLQYTRLVPSFCLNFKEVRQPLRDLLFPEKSSFELVNMEADGLVNLNGAIVSPEVLNSVEILDNEDEVFAVDPCNEYNTQDNYLFLAGFSTKKTGQRNLKIEIDGVNDFDFKAWSYPYAGFGSWENKNNTVKGKFIFFGDGIKFLLVIPKNHQKNAEIKFDVEGLGKFKFSIGDITAKRKMGLELPEFTSFQIELMNKLADHPFLLKCNNLKFSAEVNSESPVPCFQMRAISGSGKIYRSKPLFPVKLSEEKQKVNIFSCTSGRSVPVDVSVKEIVDINYAFTPEYGNILRDLKNSFFDAKLGGGFKYLDPFRIGNLPENVTNTSPKWIKSGAEWILNFDGKGNYLVFPPGTIPNGSFTLEFECKTDSKENQVLFRHYSYRPGSILLYIIDGKLHVEFASMGRNYSEKLNKLNVKLDFPLGKWVKVKISYNLQTLTFEVDGKIQKIPFNLRAAKMTASIFGGFSSKDTDITGKNLKFFQGDLRSLHIRHNAE
ncbi:MAG: hypothetical protein A2017_10050 [Lentisphaerae bacterium GWF2_44_16]|nr:MAG: hypothetical protein A2017_10050 [Lentisphaerae bacterium GWF2_44_16]